MPIYHFTVAGEPTGEGIELESLQAARCEAVKLTGEIFCKGDESFWIEKDWRLNVTNDAGLILFSLFLTAIEAPVISEI